MFQKSKIQDFVSNSQLGDNIGRLTDAQYRRYFKNNHEALQAFMARKSGPEGLNLSQRVWRYTEPFRQEIELGLDLGIRDGRSAAELSRDLRSYLQHPDRLFRRVRDERGQLHLSKAASEYHPGQGVYRSSYMNARRLAATETNIAYRTADYERWQTMDFIVGIEIVLSNNHNCRGVPKGTYYDICDELAGRYPKDFKFTGWHPHCRCHAQTILKTQEEIEEDTRRILEGGEPSQESVNRVDDVPQKFRDWVKDNRERIDNAKSKPYFLMDNEALLNPDSRKTPRYTGTKFGRTATKEAKMLYYDSQPILLEGAMLENARQAASAFGIKLTPMTFLEADEGKANVYRRFGQEYKDNCQCCVAVHEARLRGINVTAVAYSYDKESIQYKLGEEYGKIWINPKNGGPVNPKRIKGGDFDEALANLDKATKASGRYHIGLNYNDEGHVIVAERLKDGNIVFYDPQYGDFVNIREYSSELSYFEVLRVDRLLFNIELLRRIAIVL